MPMMHTASLTTGVAIASSRGRRDMSSRVKDIVLALGLCHNVRPLKVSDAGELY